MEFKTVYKAEDGTTFDTKAEVEAYIKLLKTPHIKKLLERIERLERDVKQLEYRLGIEEAKGKSPFGPFQRPQAILNGHNAFDASVD